MKKKLNDFGNIMDTFIYANEFPIQPGETDFDYNVRVLEFQLGKKLPRPE